MRKSLFLILLLALSVPCLADTANDHMKPAPVAPSFEGLQKLSGRWKGTHQTEKGPESVDVTYKLTSGNTALVETLDAGKPHEMLTVYHSDGKDVVMTHYCMVGNQPRMRLKKAEGNTYFFDFMDGTNMKPSDPHMHSLKITMVDPNHFEQEWSYYGKGDDKKTDVFRYVRK